MKIVYRENPLNTSVYLSDLEKEILYNRMAIRDFEYQMCGIKLHLENDDLERIRDYSTRHYFGQSLRDCFKMYVTELEEGSHIGDCTCVPCSCFKCHGESLLGFNSIEGLDHHQCHAVYAAYNADQVTIDEAISKLENPSFKWDEDGFWTSKKDFESWIPTWTRYSHEAAKWLKDYKQNKMGYEINVPLRLDFNSKD